MNLREWALPVYTILMQLATGALFILWLVRAHLLKNTGDQAMDRVLRRPILVVFLTILLAMIGAHFHLSNPQISFLAVLNLKRSWLSREIVFTVLMFLTCAALVDQVLDPNQQRPQLKTYLGWTAILLGAGSIFSMSSIYLLPTQAPWNNISTIILFFATSLLLGTTSAAALLVMDTIFTRQYEPDLASDRQTILERSFGAFTGIAIVALVLILIFNGKQILTIQRSEGLAHTSLMLLLDLYRPLFVVRFLALFAGVGIFGLAAFWILNKKKALPELVSPVYLACLLALVAEILGRFLFYATHVRLGL